MFAIFAVLDSTKLSKLWIRILYPILSVIIFITPDKDNFTSISTWFYFHFPGELFHFHFPGEIFHFHFLGEIFNFHFPGEIFHFHFLGGIFNFHFPGEKG